jgi:hypothetical protein
MNKKIVNSTIVGVMMYRADNFFWSMLISVGNISFYLKITIINTRDIVRFAHAPIQNNIEPFF